MGYPEIGIRIIRTCNVKFRIHITFIISKELVRYILKRMEEQTRG